MKQSTLRIIITTVVALYAAFQIGRMHGFAEPEVKYIPVPYEKVRMEYVYVAPTAISLSTAPVSEPEPTAEPERKSYNGIAEGDTITGDLSFYDICALCCGKIDGVTASGVIIANGVEPETPIASCNWLPLGTMIEINGVTHIVADRGGKSLDKVGRVDLFEPRGHEIALERGRVKNVELTVVKLP